MILYQPFDWGLIRQLLAEEAWYFYDPDCKEVRRAIGLGSLHNLTPAGNYNLTQEYNDRNWNRWRTENTNYLVWLKQEARNQGLLIDDLRDQLIHHTYLIVQETKDVNELVPGEYFINPKNNHIWLLAEEGSLAIDLSQLTTTVDDLLEHLIPSFKKG